jgi:hypothetical protein
LLTTVQDFTGFPYPHGPSEFEPQTEKHVLRASVGDHSSLHHRHESIEVIRRKVYILDNGNDSFSGCLQIAANPPKM